MNTLERFRFISGSLSLNLVNTEENRRGVRHDLLLTPQHVTHWLESMFSNQFIFLEQFPQKIQVTEEAVCKLWEQRSMLRRGFHRLADGLKVDDQWIQGMEKYIHGAPFTFVLRKNKLVPVPNGTFVETLLALIAYDALWLLSNGKLETIRRCANPKCLWLFIDETGKRKWCSMKICGNRMKVARHQHRI